MMMPGQEIQLIGLAHACPVDQVVAPICLLFPDRRAEFLRGRWFDCSKDQHRKGQEDHGNWQAMDFVGKFF
jgi:hypothetical protein